jgi:hypothetical protein
MNKLASIFKPNERVGTLPPGNPVSATYEMGFILEDDKKRFHPITCIDLPGELVEAMYCFDSGLFMEDDKLRALTTLTNILVDNKTKNRKMHFFVIEYGAEDKEYKGLTQSTYLAATAAYIKRTGIFKKDTDGIFLLITKVDKANAKGKELQEKLKAYISEHYQGFYNTMESICRENEINGGKVEIQPFTLGNVCFQSYCKFKDGSAQAVVKTILDWSYSYSTSRWSKLTNMLTK